jgi:hypothetical protein
MFIGMSNGSGDRWFRLDGQHLPALVAEFGIFLILLLTLPAKFHPSESITMEARPG